MNRPTRHSRAVEDYVKHIYKLSQIGNKATTKALAQRMGLGQGTVSGMIKQLAQRGLVEHEPYYGVKLTDAGRTLAMRMIRRHRLLELFLVRTLGAGWDEVDEDAERLEHAVSDRLVDRIDAYLGHPEVDPHGAPIPTAEGRLEPQNFQRLSELEVGHRGIIRRVADSDPQFLQYLHEQGLNLGQPVEVIATGPFGAMQVRAGRQSTHLPREAADSIFVSEP